MEGFSYSETSGSISHSAAWQSFSQPQQQQQLHSSVECRDTRVTRSNVFQEDYELKEQIGKGSFSHVLRAVHRRTGKAFAVKVCFKPCAL